MGADQGRPPGLPDETLCRELASLGVPRAWHGADSLSGLLPFINDRQFMSPDELAQLVSYLIRKDVIAPAPSGALRDLPWGSHVCHFYRSSEEVLRVLVSYFLDGLRKNYRCVWLTSSFGREEVLACMRACDERFDDALAEGRFEVADGRALPLDAGARFQTMERLVHGCDRLEKEALADGFEGVRVSCDPAGACGPGDWPAVLDYEGRLQTAVRRLKMTVLCAYRFPPDDSALPGVIDSHGSSLFYEGGLWHHLKPEQSACAYLRSTLLALRGLRE